MTTFVGIFVFVLVVGIVGALIKGMVKVAMTLGIFILLLIGAAIFVIGGMR